mgnify:CR=1 FL=1
MKSQGITVSEPGIWKWLNASAIPDQTNILALSRWLGVRPEWLEYGRNDPEPELRRESSIPPESEWGTVDAWDKNTPLPAERLKCRFLRILNLRVAMDAYTAKITMVLSSGSQRQPSAALE